MIVKFSQKAMKALASLPRDIQTKARRTIEYLTSNNEKSVQLSKLEGGRNLFSARVNSKYRVIYSKSRDTITVVDIIKVDAVANVMRSEP